VSTARKLWVVEIREDNLDAWEPTVDVGLTKREADDCLGYWEKQSYEARSVSYVPLEDK